MCVKQKDSQTVVVDNSKSYVLCYKKFFLQWAVLINISFEFGYLYFIKYAQNGGRLHPPPPN